MYFIEFYFVQNQGTAPITSNITAICNAYWTIWLNVDGLLRLKNTINRCDLFSQLFLSRIRRSICGMRPPYLFVTIGHKTIFVQKNFENRGQMVSNFKAQTHAHTQTCT